MAELPEATGKYSPKLDHITLNFQRKYHYLVLSADGLIHTASCQNRHLKFVSNDKSRLMTITLLHTEMIKATATELDYTTATLREFPNLGVWIQ